MMNKLLFALIPMLLLSIAAGCSNQHDNNKIGFSLMKTTNPAPIELNVRPGNKSIGFQVRKEVNDIPEIYDAAVIEGEKEVIVVYKVKHIHRFKMKKIEEALTKKLNKNYPDEKFIVSSDYKIFLEAIRLKEELDHKNMSNQEAEKRFKKIIKLKKEMK